MSDRIVILIWALNSPNLSGAEYGYARYCELLLARGKRRSLPLTRRASSPADRNRSMPTALVHTGLPLESGLPILGICYGMQALTHKLAGRCSKAPNTVGLPNWMPETNPLLHEANKLCGCRMRSRYGTAGWLAPGDLPNSPIAAMMDAANKRFGLQFHPEVHHQHGEEILPNFVLDLRMSAWLDVSSIIEESVAAIRAGRRWRVLSALSGGVDSLSQPPGPKAIGNRVTAVSYTGLMRRVNPRRSNGFSAQPG